MSFGGRAALWPLYQYLGFIDKLKLGDELSITSGGFAQIRASAFRLWYAAIAL